MFMCGVENISLLRMDGSEKEKEMMQMRWQMAYQWNYCRSGRHMLLCFCVRAFFVCLAGCYLSPKGGSI